MKNRKLLIPLIFCSLLLGSIALIELNKVYYLAWNANSLSVNASSPLSISKVKIKHGISILNFSTNSTFDVDPESFILLFDTDTLNPLANEYGENDFYISYEDRYYLAFRQIKLNRRYQHDYNFHFFKKEDRIFVKVLISGRNGMEFTQAMKLIVPE